MFCKSCGQDISSHIKTPKGMCQGCYNYFRKGGKVHPLPKKGYIERDEQDKVICHICGKSFRKLGGHIKEKHQMTIRDYKKEFDLCFNTQTTSHDYNQKMKEYALENHMDEQLIRTGKATRFEKNKMSKTRRSCKQEAILRSERNKQALLIRCV